MQMSERPDLNEKLDGESVAVVDVNASLASGSTGNITYQWYVNETEFQNFLLFEKELVDFCRENNLPVSGGKIELID